MRTAIGTTVSGPSIIREFEDTKAQLRYWNTDDRRIKLDNLPDSGRQYVSMDLQSRSALLCFNGNLAHETELFEGEDGYTTIFCLGKDHWRAEPEDIEFLSNTGFQFPSGTKRQNHL